MALVKIPESAFTAVQGLMGLTETDFSELVSSLDQTPPTLSHTDFVSTVISRVSDIASPLADRIVKELLNMLVAASDSDLSPDIFAAEISDAALEIKGFSEFSYQPRKTGSVERSTSDSL
jgi:hypothetical protein